MHTSLRLVVSSCCLPLLSRGIPLHGVSVTLSSLVEHLQLLLSPSSIEGSFTRVGSS